MHDEFGIGRDLVLEVQHEEREHQLLELNALERAAALDEVFGRIDVRAVLRHERDLLDVKARLGHRVAGLGLHGGKRPEARDAGMDEMGEVDDSAGLEDAEGVDDRIAGHGRVSLRGSCCRVHFRCLFRRTFRLAWSKITRLSPGQTTCDKSPAPPQKGDAHSACKMFARAPYFPPPLKKRLTARPIRQKKSRMRCRMVR